MNYLTDCQTTTASKLPDSEVPMDSPSPAADRCSHALGDDSSDWRGIVLVVDSTCQGLRHGNRDNDFRRRFALSIISGNSIAIPPPFGQFGIMGSSMFRNPGFRDPDLPVSRNWKFRERATGQFRAKFFKILNHPNFANSCGGRNHFGPNDVFAPDAGGFSSSYATPDQLAGNPVLRSGSHRTIRLGLNSFSNCRKHRKEIL
jgi:hypothetical protein